MSKEPPKKGRPKLVVMKGKGRMNIPTEVVLEYMRLTEQESEKNLPRTYWEDLLATATKNIATRKLHIKRGRERRLTKTKPRK